MFGCYVSIDGTNCQIYEPQKFDQKWWSNKMNGLGVRYEIGISIDTGDIVWAHGPFPCGSNPDVSIFRKRLKLELSDGERVIADKGYTDDMCITPDTILSPIPNDLHSLFRARHETVNKELVQISCTEFEI